jgi:hypothetical protein
VGYWLPFHLAIDYLSYTLDRIYDSPASKHSDTNSPVISNTPLSVDPGCSGLAGRVLNLINKTVIDTEEGFIN